MKKVLIMGLGDVGKAIKQVEVEAGNTPDVREIDSKLSNLKDYDVMHVCIPFSKEFKFSVLKCVWEHTPKLVIIHSTVPPGTTKDISNMIGYVVHSFVRGVHPNLYEGVKTFVKYVGGDEDASDLAIEHLESIGLETYYLGNAKTSEIAKILSTTYYGWNILFAKQAKRICDDLSVDFDKAYTIPNKTYNLGYTWLSKENVVRPVLTPPKGKIGGHCVSQNFELLPESMLKSICIMMNYLPE